MEDLIKVELSNGEAYISPFVTTKIQSEYKKIIFEGVEIASYQPSPDELEQIEKLPLAEKIKMKKSLNPNIPFQNANDAIEYLAFAMTKKLVIDGTEKAATKDLLMTLDTNDFEKIIEKCKELHDEKKEEEAKKK